MRPLLQAPQNFVLYRSHKVQDGVLKGEEPIFDFYRGLPSALLDAQLVNLMKQQMNLSELSAATDADAFALLVRLQALAGLVSAREVSLNAQHISQVQQAMHDAVSKGDACREAKCRIVEVAQEIIIAEMARMLFEVKSDRTVDLAQSVRKVCTGESFEERERLLGEIAKVRAKVDEYGQAIQLDLEQIVKGQVHVIKQLGQHELTDKGTPYYAREAVRLAIITMRSAF